MCINVITINVAIIIVVITSTIFDIIILRIATGVTMIVQWSRAWFSPTFLFRFVTCVDISASGEAIKKEMQLFISVLFLSTNQSPFAIALCRPRGQKIPSTLLIENFSRKRIIQYTYSQLILSCWRQIWRGDRGWGLPSLHNFPWAVRFQVGEKWFYFSLSLWSRILLLFLFSRRTHF